MPLLISWSYFRTHLELSVQFVMLRRVDARQFYAIRFIYIEAAAFDKFYRICVAGKEQHLPYISNGQ